MTNRNRPPKDLRAAPAATVPAPSAEVTDPYCLDEGEGRRLLARSPWRRFVVVGDGAAEGCGDHVAGFDPTPWAERVADALRGAQPQLAYINLGRRGQLATDVRSRQLAKALSLKPDLAVIACGGTDMRGECFDAYVVETELSRMIAPLRDTGCVVVTLGAPQTTAPEAAAPAATARSRARFLAERTEAVSLRHGAVYVDLPRCRTGHALWSTATPTLNSRGHALATALILRRLAARLVTGV